MKFLCLSDLHGNLPASPHHLASRGEVDAVLIAGDICPHPAKHYEFQREWLRGDFARWLDPFFVKDIPVFLVAGNHDCVFGERPGLVRRFLATAHAAGLHYLQDSAATWRGIRLWGSPWQPTFPLPRPGEKPYWAFNLDEAALAEKWAMIPVDTDILVTHGPPRGVGDYVPMDALHVGSPSLYDRVAAIGRERGRPLPLHVFGHIHSGRGQYEPPCGGLMVNASLVDERYRPVHEPIVVEIDKPLVAGGGAK